MKSRHIYRIMLGLVAFLLVANACVEPVIVVQPEEGELYPISFHIRTQDNGLQTKAGPLSGEDDFFNSLFMYCFDSNGRYLGRYQATIVSKEQKPYTKDEQQYGTFKGEVPPATARIHFVANADDCPVGGDMIGLTEEQVMHAPGLVYRSKDQAMSYWGYLRRDSPDDIKRLFDENITDETVTVLMVRDRAWIEAGNVKSGIYYNDIKWVVYNGLNNGYIATYGLPEDSEEWDEENPYQELRYTPDNSVNHVEFSLSSVVTAYPERGGRFITTENEMEPFDINHPMFVFDDECPENNLARVTKIIVAVRYIASGDESGENAAPYKFFPLCVTHGFDAEPIPIHRGHRYQISLQKLPEAAGYDRFEDAANAKTFANGALVDIPDDVIEVSDGKFSMRVKYPMTYPLSGETFLSTAILLQESATEVVVPFEVEKQLSSFDDKDFNFSESKWIPAEEDQENDPAHDDTRNVTWGSWGQGNTINKVTIGADLESTVTLPLQDVSSSLKESVFNLKGFYKTNETVDGESYVVKHVLMRNIDVYSIERFLIQEDVYDNEGNGYNDKGNLELLPLESDNRSYRLKFKLPEGTNKYPELLYPLQLKFATTTLQPTAIWIDGVKQQNAVFGVQVLTTKTGISPAYLTAPTGQNPEKQWNYQPANKNWNFWYSYPITKMPTDEEIWVDFKDMRETAVSGSILNNVGLFLYIEFFGAANAVSYDYYVGPVTSVLVNPASGDTEIGHSSNNRYQIRRSFDNGANLSTLQLKATVKPSDATYKNVVWESSNRNRASVSTDGLVTITTARARTEWYYDDVTTVEITATSVDGSKSNIFYITVTDE